MKISRVWAVYFSPTGNVKEVTNLIAKKLSEELSVPLEQWDFTLPDNRKSVKAFEKEDLVVFGTPVYAGRVPNKILPWVQQGVGSIFQSDRKCKRSDKPDRKKIVRGTVSAARAVGFYASGQPEVCQGI